MEDKHLEVGKARFNDTYKIVPSEVSEIQVGAAVPVAPRRRKCRIAARRLEKCLRLLANGCDLSYCFFRKAKG